jgi:hypothetical protein
MRKAFLVVPAVLAATLVSSVSNAEVIARAAADELVSVVRAHDSVKADTRYRYPRRSRRRLTSPQ